MSWPVLSVCPQRACVNNSRKTFHQPSAVCGVNKELISDKRSRRVFTKSYLKYFIVVLSQHSVEVTET